MGIAVMENMTKNLLPKMVETEAIIFFILEKSTRFGN